jgi:hypothetical protein
MVHTFRRLSFVALLGVPYVPILLGFVPGEGMLAGLWLAAAGLLAPAAAGALLPGGAGTARWFVRALLTAALLNVATAVSLYVAGVPPGPRSFAGVLGFVTVSTGAWGLSWGPRIPGPRRQPLFWFVGAGALLLAAFAGTRVVPPLEDQDSEVQGTAFGLAHELEPICLTNRSTLYFFAHPLLLHALNAGTLTLGGELPTVRPPYDAAVAEREKLPPEARRRGLTPALDALRAPGPRPDRALAWFREVYKPFLEDPALTATRAPNFFLAAAVAVLLLAWVRRLGAAPADAVLVVAAYATLPEIFVRSGYGGYYALTAATFLAATRLAAGPGGGGKSGYFAGTLAALSNQKALVPVAAVTGWRLLRAAAARSGSVFAPALPLLLGLLAGTTVFWIYGLWVAPQEFVADHLLEHGFRRFDGAEVVSRAGRAVYPSRPELWLEFARHFGWAWTALAVAAVGTAAVRAARSLRGAASSPVFEVTEGTFPAGLAADSLAILAAWVLLGAAVFTWTDWRQTKHLCLLVPAATVLVGWLTARAGPRLRWVVRLVLAASLGWNVVWIVRLARDFTSLTISTVW